MSKGVSYSKFAVGTVLSEGDVVVSAAEFVIWDYMGKSNIESPALHIGFTDADGNVYDQYYSAGKIDDFKPSADGKYLEILGDKKMIHEQSNFAKFFEALMKAGFPPKLVDDDDIGCLVGTGGHVQQVAIVRSGDNVKKDSTLLVFDRVTTTPGEKASAPAAEVDDETVDTAATIVMEVLAEAKDNTMPKNKILPAAIRTDTLKSLDSKVKNAVLALIKDDTFLSGSEDWTLEKGKLALA